MSGLLNIILSLLVFAVIIAVHEFGHMIAAKMIGVGVCEYSIGMGPVLFSKRFKDTCYSLRLLPIGGYCAIYGEQSFENKVREDTPEKEETSEAQSGKLDLKTDWRPEQSLSAQPWWKRIFVFIAGPFVNIFLGFLIFILFTAFGGFYGPSGVLGVFPGTAAMRAGIEPGDIVRYVDSEPVRTYNEYSQYRDMHPSTKEGFKLYVERDGEILSFDLVPDEEDKIGVVLTTFPVEKNIFNSVYYGFLNGVDAVKMTLRSLEMIIHKEVSVGDMSGFVGVTAVMSNTFDDVETSASKAEASSILPVLLSALSMAALFGINIGLMNLIPFPALDGGRIFFCLIEGIIRKPIPSKVEYAVNICGLLLLFGFLGFIMVNDLIKVCTGFFVAAQ